MCSLLTYIMYYNEHMDTLEEMSISYRKNKNATFLKSLEQPGLLNISNVQNYLAIYSRFFTLNESNWNSVNINNIWELHSVSRNPKDENFTGIVVNTDDKQRKVNVHFKLSPLLDPLKYMTGKYSDYDDELFKLPDLTGTCYPKIRNVNNSAYVDSFFSYLTSKLLHTYGFIHGIDFYGSYLGIKQDFPYNVEEDIEYLYRSEFFHLHKGTRFKIDNAYYNDILNNDSRKFKNKLTFGKSIDNISIASNSSIERLDEIFSSSEPSSHNKDDKEDNDEKDDKIDMVFNQENPNKSKSTSSTCSHCSSRSSITDNEDNDEEYDDDEDSESTGSDANVNVIIDKFPVQIISLEKCDNTLDSLIETDLGYGEIVSALMQLIMTLITYQKVFHFTHNDLHTNNVMYQPTEKQYIYYKYDNSYYKVPTFGRIYKIIDFGRGIYKFKGHQFVSDSFHKDGDAATQYNIEPFMNNKKPFLEPNYSFDLCRLACSLFDVFVPEDDNETDDVSHLYNPIKDLIEDWCKDDKGRNILYKTHGEERYPNFKLYKMIARTVHGHTPTAQLKRDIFSNYKVPRKSISRKAKIVNIDKIPVLI